MLDMSARLYLSTHGKAQQLGGMEQKRIQAGLLRLYCDDHLENTHGLALWVHISANIFLLLYLHGLSNSFEQFRILIDSIMHKISSHLNQMHTLSLKLVRTPKDTMITEKSNRSR